MTEFPEFCYQTFRVTGDGTTKAGPRHRNSVCPACLKAWAVGKIREGRLYVRCPVPDCGRSLQTLELKTLVPQNDYNLLVMDQRSGG